MTQAHRHFSALILGLGLSSFGCRGNSPTSTPEALAHNRFIIGAPIDWVPTAITAERVETSVTARRQAAWRAIAQVLQPVTLFDPRTHTVLRDATTGQTLTLPAWQTWYELEEFKAMFADLYWRKLTSEQRLSSRVDDAQVDQELEEFPRRPLEERWQQAASTSKESRFERLLEQLTDPQNVRSVNGVSGQGYTLFSPALVRHYLRHFGPVSLCRGTPPDATTGTSADFATCFGEAFPPGAAAIKATWSNTERGVAVFDTSAKGLADLMTVDQQSWVPAPGVGLARPDATAIYTAQTFVDSRKSAAFQLTGLHLIIKDIPNWLWTTLWWSPEPNSDFGEDRPAAIVGVDGGPAPSVWANYKMCTVAHFDEGDIALRRAAAGISTADLRASHDRSLRASLLAADHFAAPNTLCSNPFFEFQRGAGGTNCIGCHQHSGPFAAKPQHRPDRARKRQNFMADFLWSFEDSTEQFRGAIVEVRNDPQSALR